MSSKNNTLSRRNVLKAAGASLVLPWLDAFAARSARAENVDQRPRRMVAIMTDMGMIPEYFFPESSGKDYPLSPYLRVLEKHRKDFTVFSGLSHPEVTGGHQADLCFLTGAPHPRKPGFKNSVSLDQYAAAALGPVTRFPSLTLRVGPSDHKTLSYSSDGVAIPSEDRPSQIFRKLFLQGSPAEVERQIARLRDGRSLMDRFVERLHTLERKVPAHDRQRLDQFLTSVRDVEKRLHASQQWERQPKPSVAASMPEDQLDPTELLIRTRAIYDLTALALETDSTRLVTIFITQQFNPKVNLPGIEIPHHSLTHQMSKKDARGQLKTIEQAQMQELAELLSRLGHVHESGETLLDRTMVLYGSNLGNASRHDNFNLPILLAGGGFRHGRHLAFDNPKAIGGFSRPGDGVARKRGEFSSETNVPLAKLYVSMLQRLGLETDQFAGLTGRLPGLEES